MHALRDIALFRPLADDALASLEQVATEVEVREGEELISEGTTADEWFVILDGQAEVWFRGTKVAGVGPGDPVGEVAVLLRRPRTATVRATSSLRALRLGGEDLRRLMRESPNFAAVIGRHLSRREPG